MNDFSRTLSAKVWEQVIPRDAITIFSGGTEGVLSPHVTFVVKSDGRSVPGPTCYGIVGHTRPLKPEEVGTPVHARVVNDTISDLLAQNSLTPDTVRLVLTKCPLLTSDKMSTARAQGHEPVTSDTYTSMAYSRRATAVGTAIALGECSQPVDKAMNDESIYSSIASCSSGAELEDCHILILASTPSCTLQAVTGVMRDALDAQTIIQALDRIKAHNGKLVQLFAKAEADPTGRIRGFRHTMNTDSDLHSTRHARAAVGGLLAGLLADPMIYVSGGGEGQGPPGGGSFSIFYT